ncbi:MAG: glycosyltransferase family 2 protein [Betaproteobacteria bacterium]|nr:glycosyltransferase family 2 protein [Betaproteobacteria bacterium]
MQRPIEISVVIPAKNRAGTLPECLESVLAQTYPASEIIVVDDGSTDDTHMIVESYAPRGVSYVRLTVGKGAQAARNFGIGMAKCEWIAFQDSDDVWLPDKLALQVKALKEYGFDPLTVVHGNGLKCFTAMGKKMPFSVPHMAGWCYEKLLLQPAPMFQSMLTSKTAILQAVGLDNDCPSYQEWDTSIRLSRHCQFMHIEQPLFEWHWHDGDTISKDLRRDVLGFNYVMNAHRSEIMAVHGMKAWRKLKITNVVRALRWGLWDEAMAFMNGEPTCPAFIFARALAKTRRFPAGTATLLKLLAV